MHYLIPNKTVPLSVLASKVNGRIVGDKSKIIKGLCSNDESKDGCITLYTGQSATQLKEVVSKSHFSAVIVSEGCKFDELQSITSLLYVKNPIEALVKLMPEFFEFRKESSGISSKAEVHSSAKVGKNVTIGAFAVVGADCVIEEGVVIHPNVTIYPNVTVGAGSIIHSGAVIREYCTLGKFSVVQNGAIIGSDGFGYYFDGTMLQTVPQIGVVRLGDHVDLGANSCIDRATLGSTTVDLGSKLDNLVQIGHNVKIGRMSILCGQVGVAGSCKIGNGVTLGGQVGVGDHAHIGDKARFAAQSGAIGNYSGGEDYAGTPAIPAQEWRRQSVLLRKLRGIISKLKTN